MFISEISIVNFRGLTITLNNLKSEFLIIGKNDSGKSNICYAIRKVLDINTRRVPFNSNDSTNCNKKDIEIKIRLNIEGISESNKNKIGKYYDGNSLVVSLKAKYDESSDSYNEDLIIGEKDKFKFSSNNTNAIDNILDLIYIHPGYNLDRDKKLFFKTQQKISQENGKPIDSEIRKKVKDLNEAIKTDNSIKEMDAKINNRSDFKLIFEDINFKIQSNIDILNFYNSLSIAPFINGEEENLNIGDGKNKTLAMLLQRLSYEDDKEKILLLEEPENHLFPLLQKCFTSIATHLDVSQTIVTTHSPYIIDFEKMKQIIKLIVSKDEHNERRITRRILDIDDFKKSGFLFTFEIAEMFFFDKVLLIEGYSEKYFYNLLEIEDKTFRDFLIKEKFGIFCIYGISFKPTKELLEKLGIEVWIKTDNDIFPKKKIYAGISRVYECLDEESKKELSVLLQIKDLNKSNFKIDDGKRTNSNLEKNMKDIVKIFKRNRVLLSQHHKGFEKDFVDFIGEKEKAKEYMDFLKEAKLRNLHELIVEKHLIEKMKITQANKDLPIVGFYHD